MHLGGSVKVATGEPARPRLSGSVHGVDDVLAVVGDLNVRRGFVVRQLHRHVEVLGDDLRQEKVVMMALLALKVAAAAVRLLVRGRQVDALDVELGVALLEDRRRQCPPLLFPLALVGRWRRCPDADANRALVVGLRRPSALAPCWYKSKLNFLLTVASRKKEN